MFPADEMSAKALKADRAVELFSVYVRDGDTVFVLPKNMKDFTKSLFMVSILKAASAKGYILETSIDKEMPAKILKTDDEQFVAGYVYQALQPELGDLDSGTSKFAKGKQAYQRSCIERTHKNSRHLKRGGDTLLEKRVGQMTSFTQAHWSDRNRLLSLLKSLDKKRPTNLVSYLKSRQEMEKLIHTSVSYDNRGVFRPEEIDYLNNRYRSQMDALQAFRDRLTSPNERLATHFEEDYSRIRRDVKAAEQEVQTTLNRRADLLFVKGAKKKRDIEFNKTKLLDKIASFDSPDRIAAFIPSTLPGIGLKVTTHNILLPIDNKPWTDIWSVPQGDNAAQGVITSWEAYLAQFIAERV
jgi:hypothetical protein